MFPRRRLPVLWFCAGVLFPLALWALSALLTSADLPRLARALELAGIGSCPFWLFLWVPAMGLPTSEIAFYSTLVAVLLANGALYLVMAFVQNKTRDLKRPLRLATLVIAYPALMALGYCVPLGAELVL